MMGAPITLFSPAPEWFETAPCRGLHGLFFSDKLGRTANIDTANAKAICRGCPHRLPCLDFALDNNEVFGVWGGTAPRERRGIRKRRVA